MNAICPPIESFSIQGEQFSPAEVLAVLSPQLTAARLARLRHAVAARIASVVPVLEGLYDRGNVSAVMRSAEGLGYLGVHIIDTSQSFKEANRVTQGAEKWLDVRLWEDTPAAVHALKQQGFRVLATHFEQAAPLPSFAFDVPTAIVFGNEREGVSKELLEAADARVYLPMAGLSQSFNISVAAALFLYHIREDRAARLGRTGDLSPEAQEHLLASYCLRSVQAAEQVLLRSRAATP